MVGAGGVSPPVVGGVDCVVSVFSCIDAEVSIFDNSIIDRGDVFTESHIIPVRSEYSNIIIGDGIILNYYHRCISQMDTLLTMFKGIVCQVYFKHIVEIESSPNIVPTGVIIETNVL